MPETLRSVLTKQIEIMEIKLSKEESEEYFYNALCNGLGSVCGNYSLELSFDDYEYSMARKSLTNTEPCYEDVLMAMLKMGFKLTLKDLGYEGEHDSTIGLDDVHERVQMTPIRHLIDVITMDDDGDTADVIIQHVFHKECIFG